MAIFDEYGSNLIFVISLPRSGSTLLQHILGGNPDVLALQEPWIMLHPLYALKQKGFSAEYEAWQARDALHGFLANTEGGMETYMEAIRSMASVLYGSALRRSGKQRFLDKTPRYYHIIPELYRVFPSAKFVILLRNPLAVLSSVVKTWFDNRPDIIDDGNRQDLFEGPRLLLEGIRTLGKDAIVLHYEKLVAMPESQVEGLCARLGLQFSQAMLEYDSPSYSKGQFGDPVGISRHTRPVTDPVDRWVGNLVSEELTDFARDYLDTLGEDLVGRLGYNFTELHEKISSPAASGEA